ncbi:uncharacterized protein L3040_001239 [Drepanopeziza brunnea f. sp. 'multigermtubi']|uniref:uncharacterized protein n=1 Tax=Drepanopeziza brunnea f. sp. 'multigermtubi' TaxID=698441 RepID=UPI0023A4A5B9|nr:hypothetical protein L3040_001239 [Drepanopeziza brunnea f. sp. 'multigermtubi']
MLDSTSTIPRSRWRLAHDAAQENGAGGSPRTRTRTGAHAGACPPTPEMPRRDADGQEGCLVWRRRIRGSSNEGIDRANPVVWRSLRKKVAGRRAQKGIPFSFSQLG